MHTPNPDPGEGRLTALLRANRPAPALPPRFQENVWRRIEQGPRSLPVVSWLEWLASLVLRPRFALATACALVLLGAVLGSFNGAAHARHNAQARYLAAVAMPASH
jgi:hypothetical protein